MGYVMHNAIVVTSWEEVAITAAYDKAVEIGCQVTDIAPSPLNGYRTFVLVPDGSKEGWYESDLGDEARSLFKNWLRAQRYDDGSGVLEWCEVRYGSSGPGAAVVEHEWSDRAAAEVHP